MGEQAPAESDRRLPTVSLEERLYVALCRRGDLTIARFLWGFTDTDGWWSSLTDEELVADARRGLDHDQRAPISAPTTCVGARGAAVEPAA